jgi:MHS family alpha-ketoglutarate permease-like MFS transporter
MRMAFYCFVGLSLFLTKEYFDMTTTAHSAAELKAQQRAETRKSVKAIVASATGNLVEWYDFYIYSFAAIYFSSQFFPTGSQTSQLLKAAAVFGIGFVMRPVGSWFFGRIADRKGRKASLLLSVVLMCLGSLVIAILPTFSTLESWGINGLWAAVFLTLARMLQGFSAGGEYGATATYMSEVATSRNRGFLASFQYVTLIGGQLLATLVLLVLGLLLSKEEMVTWGWRIPFLIGAAAALVALYLRRKLHETAPSDAQKNKEAGTIKGLRNYKKGVMLVFCITAASSLCFYTYTTYMQKFLVNTAGMDPNIVHMIFPVVLILFMIMQPFVGAWSDRVGRRNHIITFGIFMAVVTYPVLTFLGQGHSPIVTTLVLLIPMFGLSFYTSISGIFKAELFPPHVRALGVGFPYAIANAIFGGSAEYLALQFKDWNIPSVFYVYVVCMAIMVTFMGFLMPDSRKRGAKGIAQDLSMHEHHPQHNTPTHTEPSTSAGLTRA